MSKHNRERRRLRREARAMFPTSEKTLTQRKLIGKRYPYPPNYRLAHNTEQPPQPACYEVPLIYPYTLPKKVKGKK